MEPESLLSIAANQSAGHGDVFHMRSEHSQHEENEEFYKLWRASKQQYGSQTSLTAWWKSSRAAQSLHATLIGLFVNGLEPHLMDTLGHMGHGWCTFLVRIANFANAHAIR